MVIALKFLIASASIIAVQAAVAQESTTFTYDAKGRVVTVTRTGGPSGGVTTTYSYDRADNRTNVTVTGAPVGTGPASRAPAPLEDADKPK